MIGTLRQSKRRIGPQMSFRFEFDPVNKILLLRFDGRLTDESVVQATEAARIHWATTAARAGIADYSSVTEFAVSSALVQSLPRQKPPMPDVINNPLILVMPAEAGYGLARMYQIVGDLTLPSVSVVHTMDEAFATLGVQSPSFEPLE